MDSRYRPPTDRKRRSNEISDQLELGHFFRTLQGEVATAWMECFALIDQFNTLEIVRFFVYLFENLDISITFALKF